jgi:hypothetical protein
VSGFHLHPGAVKLQMPNQTLNMLPCFVIGDVAYFDFANNRRSRSNIVEPVLFEKKVNSSAVKGIQNLPSNYGSPVDVWDGKDEIHTTAHL